MPAITCVQDTTIKIGETLSFEVIVSDADGDPVVLGATALPDGAEFLPQSGQFTWTPEAAQVGDHLAIFAAQDSAGGMSEHQVSLHVRASNQPPYFASVVPADSMVWVNNGQSVRFQIGAIDPDEDALSIQWFFNGLLAGQGDAITILTTKSATVAVRVSDGTFLIERNWRIEVATGVEVDPQPDDFALLQNYPNPANPGTTIVFSLPHADHVQLTLLNQTGQCVAMLIDGIVGAGTHRLYWDGRDQSGNPAPSGVYLYVVEEGKSDIWQENCCS